MVSLPVIVFVSTSIFLFKMEIISILKEAMVMSLNASELILANVRFSASWRGNQMVM
ncbi:hypothetical protein HanPSC8_Chr16g0720221 [Helianthus annuus]|nr:hypothetical protein HanPSC8_Chr16g0720221 [Helianthus annuus]